MQQMGTIFDIQKFSIHDGPGIRTNVFLKGCTLHCYWCHNPESILPAPQIMVFEHKCIGCGKCVEVCPNRAHSVHHGRKIFIRERCRQCGKCVQNCYAGALELSGKKMTVEEVMEVVEQDRNFYETSGGGVTFSGGEPLLQFRFLRELLKESKNRGFHTAVETAGNVEWQAFEEIVELTDLFLYDIKVLDRKKHIQATGSNNDRCLSNLQQLVRRKANICVRIPVIEHVNDSQEDMQQIADYLSACSHNIPVELLPFHKMGAEKYKGLGIPYRAENTQVPSETKMEKLRKVFPTIVHK